MKPLILLAALAVTAEGATYRVCWSSDKYPAVHCGEGMRKAAADSFTEQSNRDFPNIHYWVVTEFESAGWKRARWVGAGAALAAGIFDAHTTMRGLAAGEVETNFLYGAHPSAARVYGTNIGPVVAQFLIVEWWRRRHPETSRITDRNGFFGELTGVAIHVGAGIHNEALLDRDKQTKGR